MCTKNLPTTRKTQVYYTVNKVKTEVNSQLQSISYSLHLNALLLYHLWHISFHRVSTSSTCISCCCMSKALRSSTVKTLFYSYVFSSGYYVGFSSVFSKLKSPWIS